MAKTMNDQNITAPILVAHQIVQGGSMNNRIFFWLSKCICDIPEGGNKAFEQRCKRIHLED